jgi:DmsE family decaheme c-type cytochrome
MIASILLAAATAVFAQDAKSAPEFVGASKCLECHSDREHFKENIHAKAWPKAKGIEYEKSCETCHGPGSKHAEAAGDRADAGFATIKSFKKLTAKEASQTCLECHKGGDRFHWNSSVHDSKDVSCVSCHSMHRDDKAEHLMAKGSVAETCYQCHNVKKSQFMRSSHMPVREGKMTCTNCHNPHGSQGPTLLKQLTVNENCTSCHAEKKGPFLWEHPPVRENCLNCHNPHGSQHAALLKVKRPRLCQQCHLEGNHPATASIPTNLHLASRSCTECHAQIHGSNHPSGVRFMR